MNVDSLSSLNCGAGDYIISNFAVIDKTGAGKIFEIDLASLWTGINISSFSFIINTYFTKVTLLNYNPWKVNNIVVNKIINNNK